MKFLVFTDIHGNADVLDSLDDEFSSCDAVIFAGDFADVIAKKDGTPVLEKLCKKHDEIYAVLGNHDSLEFLGKLEDAGINAERMLNYTGGFAIIGSGGATFFTRDTPNERSEEDILSDYAILKTSENDGADGAWSNLIIISHNPPKDTKCDAVNEHVHAGSEGFRALIEEIKPLAVITGHIHEGVGIDKIGDTVVINAGSLGLSGKYAILEVEKSGDIFSVKNAELKSIK